VFNPDHPNIIDTDTNYGKQFIYIIVSIIIGIIILLLESRFLNALAPAFYVITILLLMLVLVIGKNVGGNQAWINMGGGFRLQPSEFAKYTTCLLLARYLSGTNIKVTEIKSFLIAGGIILLPMLLIKMQPDDGSTLVFCSLIFVLYREGISPYFLIVTGLVIALFILSLVIPNLVLCNRRLDNVGLLLIYFSGATVIALGFNGRDILSIGFVFVIRPLYNHGLKSHQKERIDVVLGITHDTKHVGYNQNQSKIAIGSGRMWGKGLSAGYSNQILVCTRAKYRFYFLHHRRRMGFCRLGCSGRLIPIACCCALLYWPSDNARHSPVFTLMV
jgi:rod shape determining protein RodA